MPEIRMQLDAELGGLVASATGRLSANDMRRLAERVWADEGFGGCYIVWDMRAASFDLSQEEVRDLADFAVEHSSLLQGSRMAYVAMGNVEFGLARMMSNLRARGGVEQMVSRDFDEAHAWARQAPAAVARRTAD